MLPRGVRLAKHFGQLRGLSLLHQAKTCLRATFRHNNLLFRSRLTSVISGGLSALAGGCACISMASSGTVIASEPRNGLGASKRKISSGSVHEEDAYRKDSSELSSPEALPDPPVYLSASTAAEIDKRLMAQPGFSIDYLMELAGLACAVATDDFARQACAAEGENGAGARASERAPAPARTVTASSPGARKSILVLAGPGNNGGDALVAARHLKHFGHAPVVVYPKVPDKQLFLGLLQQLEDADIPVSAGRTPDGSLITQEFQIPSAHAIRAQFDVVLDGLFGFSFKGSPRPPFDDLLKSVQDSGVPVLSIDVPSGWDVDRDTKAEGAPEEAVLRPSGLISLTAPKQCAKGFVGVHYLGGRFVPGNLQREFGLEGCMGLYRGTSPIARLSGTTG